MTDNFTELAFTDSVKALQEKYGTRAAYSRMERGGKFRNQLTWQEKKHIADRDGFYLSSVGENGWPYMQFRGGPKGFLKAIDDHTLGFADFRGNGQYISTGNFIDNNKTMLFLMDYPNKRRLKIWAEAEVLDAADHPELAQQLIMPDYEAIVERIIIFKVHAFDWNCPQHIIPRYTQEEAGDSMLELESRIADLEAENKNLRHQVEPSGKLQVS
ncbi:MAG: pyridoxamine 5'-phosphate oxidase family protein [Nitrospinae bacterium]|nr:pyridoxamine 5'-phosphate oxidase family protein [Nitrospinota bacterium]